ncbi:MAG TPA: amino acid ABC transporter permease, partial [Rhodocyclaceae bacterium]|nr:amino acid ABC transporter permease [Rhodocyclaceae bacterium]
FGLRPSAWVAGTLGLTLHASAYLGEIWRGSILSVPRQQWEAAESLALSPWQMRLYVILPQAVQISIAPTVGFLVQLLKNSSLVSIVGIEELMRASSMMNTATWKPFLVLSTAAIIYFCICFPLTSLSRHLEKKTHVYN